MISVTSRSQCIIHETSVQISRDFSSNIASNYCVCISMWSRSKASFLRLHHKMDTALFKNCYTLEDTRARNAPGQTSRQVVGFCRKLMGCAPPRAPESGKSSIRHCYSFSSFVKCSWTFWQCDRALKYPFMNFCLYN